VGPRVDVDAVEKRKNLPLLGIKTRPSNPEQVPVSTELQQMLSFEMLRRVLLWKFIGYLFRGFLNDSISS
jgi:hypothetical protein